MDGDGSLKSLKEVFTYINQLSNPETRENALLELSKKRESVADLALMLWNSFGTIAGKKNGASGSFEINTFYYSSFARNCQYLSINNTTDVDRTTIESGL